MTSTNTPSLRTETIPRASSEEETTTTTTSSATVDIDHYVILALKLSSRINQYLVAEPGETIEMSWEKFSKSTDLVSLYEFPCDGGGKQQWNDFSCPTGTGGINKINSVVDGRARYDISSTAEYGSWICIVSMGDNGKHCTMGMHLTVALQSSSGISDGDGSTQESSVSDSEDSSSSSLIIPILGAVIGAVVIVAGVVAAKYYFKRGSKKHDVRSRMSSGPIELTASSPDGQGIFVSEDLITDSISL